MYLFWQNTDKGLKVTSPYQGNTNKAPTSGALLVSGR